MERAPVRGCLLALVIIPLSVSLAVAEGPSSEATPASGAAAAVGAILPDQMADVAKGAPAPATLVLERQALDRIEREYAPKIRELHDLARQAKGLEHAELQKRIGALKREQERKGLEARIEAARQAGDERRLQQLTQVSEESSKPRPRPAAPAEIRPVPLQEREGGAR